MCRARTRGGSAARALADREHRARAAACDSRSGAERSAFASWQGPGAVARAADRGARHVQRHGLVAAARAAPSLAAPLRGGAPVAIALAPAWLFLAAALTNESHGLAFRGRSRRCGVDCGGDRSRSVLSPGRSRASPRERRCSRESGVRLWREGERRSGLALLLVMPAQPLLFFADLRGAVELTYPLAAASLTVAALVLATTLLRYSLLQPPPLGHRQVIDHLRHGVLMASATGEVLDHNAAAERLLGGAPRGHSIADAIAALVPTAQREPIRIALERVGRHAGAGLPPGRRRSPSTPRGVGSPDPGRSRHRDRPGGDAARPHRGAQLCRGGAAHPEARSGRNARGRRRARGEQSARVRARQSRGDRAPRRADPRVAREARVGARRRARRDGRARAGGAHGPVAGSSARCRTCAGSPRPRMRARAPCRSTRSCSTRCACSSCARAVASRSARTSRRGCPRSSARRSCSCRPC